jgi:hypothetical protein
LSLFKCTLMISNDLLSISINVKDWRLINWSIWKWDKNSWDWPGVSLSSDNINTLTWLGDICWQMRSKWDRRIDLKLSR